jgi:hypothetical protein
VKLKRRTLSLSNVVSYRVDLLEGDRLFDIVDETVDYFRQVLVHNGYYTTAPMVFRGLPDSREFTMLTTLGNRVNLIGGSDTGFEFREHVGVDTDFFYRHCDIEEPVPYAEIDRAVTEAGSTVRDIHHVILDVYGETMLDLYVEAEKS